MNVKLLSLCLILTLLTAISTGYCALRPRWTPPKPVSVSVTDNDFRDCITVKFVEGSGVRMRDETLTSLNGYNLKPFYAVISRFKVISISRLFSRPEQVLNDERERGQRRSGKELADLNNYYRIIIDKAEAPEPFIEALLSLIIVETAYAVPIPTVAEDIDPETPDYTEGQGYLYEAPEGINAPAAWEFEGGRGEGVKIIDIEGGWTFDHEDFREPFFVEMDNPLWVNHGDAVIGVMISGHNGYGMDGICPEAEIGGYSMTGCYPDNGWPNVADIINETAAALDEGDIYLIELHCQFNIYMSPMETWQENFDAIETASANGIICCEAGGNGNSNLDAEVYEGRYDPENRHSGAILVGAGNPPSGNFGEDRSRCEFSNYGQRVDLQGWGREVWTAGYGDLFYPNNDQRQWYTRHFSGTSSATPIVAGAVACVQGMYKARTGGELTLSSMEIRDILVETGTPQNDQGEQGHIGPRPNLEDIRDQLIVPGVLYGTVTDAENDDPLEGVTIQSNFGFNAVTDEEGYYRIDPMLAEIAFNLTASLEGYNDSTLVDLLVEEDDSLEANFALLHPEFESSQREFYAMLDPELEEEIPFSLTNDGNGPLDWQLRKRLPNDADVPWEHRESFFVGESVEDTRIKGVVYTDGQFYCAGGGNDTNYIYVLDREGEPVDRFEQFADSRYGMSDLAWDGSLLWGSDGRTIFGFTTEGERQITFEGPFNPTSALAWDPDRQLLWLSGLTTQYIAGYNRGGREVMRTPRQGFRITGLAFWSDDPDGYPLYIFHKVGSELQVVHKMNPDNGDTVFVSIPMPPHGGSPEGAFITNQYDVYSWVFMGVSSAGNDDGGDRIDLWQLQGRTDWYGVYPAEGELVELFAGRIEAEETRDFTLFLNSWDLPPLRFVGELLFRHNAAGGADTLHVELDVMGNVAPAPFGLISPENDASFNGNDEETLVTFVWEESDDPNWGDIVRYQLLLQSGMDSVSFGLQDTTSLTVNMEELDPLMRPEPLDLIWWVKAVSDPDITPSTDRFTLHYTPVGVDSDQSEIPVEFGLESIYPCPFNSVTTVRFGMDHLDRVLLRVYDISGREVAVLFNETVRTGHYSVVWDASDLASGLYFVRLEAGNRIRTTKIALVR